MQAEARVNPDRPTRLIFYVGKGGVGRTTIAAATAIELARRNQRTLVVSTNASHNLGDVLGTELGSEPRQLAPSLYAEEINVLDEIRRNWGRIREHLPEMLSGNGASGLQPDELAILPGMDELAALVQIGRHIRGGAFDCIVVDAPPTGETIRLLTLPESYQWYAERIREWSKHLPRYVGPLLRSMAADLSGLDVVTQVADRTQELRGILSDPQRSSYRIVLTPDRVVLKDAVRAQTYLNVFNFPVDAVIVNRHVSTSKKGSFVDDLLKRQSDIMTDIQRAFATMPLLMAPWFPEEPIGQETLADLGRQLFGDRDPMDVMYVGPTQQIERTETGYSLRIPLAHHEIGKLKLRKRGDTLFIEVGAYRREIALPPSVAALEPQAARVREGTLEIPFVSRESKQQPAEANSA